MTEPTLPECTCPQDCVIAECARHSGIAWSITETQARYQRLERLVRVVIGSAPDSERGDLLAWQLERAWRYADKDRSPGLFNEAMSQLNLLAFRMTSPLLRDKVNP